jgi:uncharacterized protein YkwD
MLAHFKHLQRIKHAKVYLDCALTLIVLIAASCSGSTMPTTVSQTANPITEMIVASTFTPAPVTAEDIETAENPLTQMGVMELTPTVPGTNLDEETENPSDMFTEVTVEAGDALINFALEYNVPMAAIQLANNMGDSTVVRIGQVLAIPHPEGWVGASPYWILHVVQAGESISKIAANFGLVVTEVVEVNSFAEADLIVVGQHIILPLEGPAEVMTAAQAPFPTPIPPTATLLSPTQTPLPPMMDETDTPPAPSPTDTPVPQPVPVLSGDTAAMRMEIYRLLNEQRAIYNLAPLIWNDILASAAQKHADDCYQRGWCGHTGSDGSTMKTRIIREGYDPTRWSECWAWYETPEKAVAMWMDEVPPNDPHRRTILSTYLTEVGVGVVPGNGNGYYFIADFGTP